MLQGFDRLGLHVAVSHPDGKREGEFSERFPRPDQRVVVRKQRRFGGRDAADTVFGDDAGILQRRHGGGRHQGDVGTTVGKNADYLFGIGQQQFGAEVTFALDTIDEWGRAETRHDGYTWNYDHHP